MYSMNENNDKQFAQLVHIMNELREKCPWDKKQTIHTLRSMTIEEMYELGDAIIEENWQEIKEELGDLLLHILFYARIASEQNKFNIHDVIASITQKMIEGHPHIYGTAKVKDEEEVKRNWQKIKLAKGKTSVLSGVPSSLPAVVKATRLQEKAKQIGFEWENIHDVWKKVEEEQQELKEAIESENQLHIEEEMGDLFFSLINYARFLDVDVETALEKTNKKFMFRFMQMESIAKEHGTSLADMTLEEMDLLWNEIKQKR